MAHGYLKLFAENEAEIYSAGLETHGLNPLAVKVMKEDNVDISHHTSNLLDDYLDHDFDLVLTVCDHANETCPVFPKCTTKVHKNFSDPSKSNGKEEEIMESFRKTRQEIRQFCEELIGEFIFNE
jgi:arsenate reductase